MILPPSPLLQLVPARAEKTLQRLQEMIWLDPQPLTEVFHAETTAAHRPLDAVRNAPLQRAERGLFWGKYFDQKWFKVVIPGGAAAGTYLHWPTQGEGTAYIDGQPFYGFDVAHARCLLPVGTAEVWIDVMCAQTGIWLAGETASIDARGVRYVGGSLVRRDDDAWEAYHDLFFLHELAREEHKDLYPPSAPYGRGTGFVPPVREVSVLYRRLLRFMDQAINALDTGGVTAMRAVLRDAYAALPAEGPKMEVITTGHAHIDLVWLWTEKAGESKAVHTFSSMNRMMELYPEFRFGYSQPASYEAVGRRAPGLLEQVKARIAEGRWEATGAAEVESDTNLSCGESLARAFVVGQRRFREIRGDDGARVLWLPDVFGYCASLPQILSQMGVPYFFTTKLTWGSITPFPYSSFVWRGPDGSEVLAYVTQGHGYNSDAKPSELRIAARHHRQSDVHPEALVPTGYGDGGGGTTEAFCERVRRAGNLAGVPRTRWDNIEKFFHRLAARRADLPVYQGELYLEYHRGVQTSISRVKAAYRACERAMQTWESGRCALGTGEVDQKVWQRVVFTQFHDYIPGSSRQEVYDEGVPELERIAADAVAATATELGSGKSERGSQKAEEGAACVWNPLPYPRTVIANGAPRVLGPLMGGPVADLPLYADSVTLDANAERITNDRVEARFDTAGRVTALRVDGRDLALDGPLGELVVFPDHPHAFEAWDIDRGTLALGSPVPAEAVYEGAKPGDGEVSVTFRRQLTARSTARVRYALAVGDAALRVDYDVDWQDEATLLKAVFPTLYRGQFARYAAPYGSVLRSQQPGEERAEAQWEVPASRWAAIMDDGDAEGLAVITEAKYGFTGRSGVLSVSLVRSPLYSCADDHAALRPAEPPLVRFSDLGKQTIRLAITLHSADRAREDQAAALADTLFTPPVPYQGTARDAGLLALEGGASLQPCWAKPAEDGKGWILRLTETLGRRGVVQLRLADGWRASLTDLREGPGAAVEGGRVAFTPYQLLSVRIEK